MSTALQGTALRITLYLDFSYSPEFQTMEKSKKQIIGSVKYHRHNSFAKIA